MARTFPAGWPTSAVLPADSALGSTASADGALSPGASGAAAGVQVSAMRGLLPLMGWQLPFF
jgi:hypothetical protein